MDGLVFGYVGIRYSVTLWGIKILKVMATVDLCCNYLQCKNKKKRLDTIRSKITLKSIIQTQGKIECYKIHLEESK